MKQQAGVATASEVAPLLDPSLSVGARLLFVLIGHYTERSEKGPGQIGLAKNLGVSVRQLRRWLTELRQAELVDAARYRSRAADSQPDNRSAATEVGAKVLQMPVRSQATETPDPPLQPPLVYKKALREEEPSEREELLQEPLFSQLLAPPARSGRDQVREAWLAAKIVCHRNGYFAQDRVRRKLDQAIARYGVADVCAAIGVYAEILDSPEHYWTHRWTLLDFLGRGLDKFVPEALPLENFRTKNGTHAVFEPSYRRLAPGETF